MEFTKKVYPSGKMGESISLHITIPYSYVEAYDIKPYDLVVFDLKRVIKNKIQ